ncbi:NADPH2:quinone reductase [Streptomyces sp. DvalAA-14]|uniref:alcohol dehydrogenase catalytic domain-containing protein n=1 Tax=unclassified Streptomyces TaxID=2593676 RepID=UPI00081B0750|nr:MULTISPECIES: alcohol dehydrogenase catalytic domain-containing protein [unclassified Streptomyces]MYS19372.1 alcohol dehydrogenase catalytic domain-containing protein [Streptomyces sp. SID4948]SCD43046.1 NADPH2:quinone reductase [Streptomyces sp. DvalAA-14]
MRAAELSAPNSDLELVERDVPSPGPGEILVKMTACGMCNSEVSLVKGEYPFAHFPTIPGHEVIGTVAELGQGVTWPQAGTQVGAQFLYDSDMTCDYCVRGDQILCPNKRITGVVTDGGYAEYAVFKEGFVTPVPEGLDPVAGAPLMCAGLTAFNGLRQAGVTSGSRVAVLGVGAVGGMAVRFALAMGAQVAVLGRSHRSEQRAKELGAQRYIATGEQDAVAALKSWGYGADVLLNTTPSTKAATALLGGLAPDGTLSLLGYGPDPLELPSQLMVLNRLHVMASPSGSPHNARDTLDFALRHDLMPDVTPIGLDEAPATLAKMVNGEWHNGRAVITF